MAPAEGRDDEGIPPLGVAMSIAGGEATVVVVGEMDVFTVPRLREALRDAERRRVKRVVMDVGGVSFIDVLGLNVLVAIAADCRDRGIGFALRNPSDEVLRIQQLVGIDETTLPLES